MPFLPQRHDHELDGDFMRRRARSTMLLFLVLLPVTLWLFARIEPIWLRIAPLEGGIFLVASALLGTVLAITPILTLALLLMGVWYGVESVYRARTRTAPLLDRLIVGAGLLVWFSPALALAAAALRAVLAGSISFSRPQRQYLLATDPIAFWQSIGFLMIVALALAYPAWHYWRGKFGRREQAV